MGSKLDLNQLRIEIRKLHRSHELYRLLREELGKIGHWKQKPRGDPKKGFQARGKKG